MRLINVHVTNYKCIEDSELIQVEDVTCLVGKNESGKTAFLESLYKLNPIDPDEGDFDLLEYPRRKYSQYKSKHETSPDWVIRASFEIDDKTFSDIEADYGCGVLRKNTFTLHKNYKNRKCWSVDINEEKIISELVKNGRLPAPYINKLSKAKNFSQLKTLLDEIENKPKSVNALKTLISERYPKDLKDLIVEKYLEPNMPFFVYFDDYNIMEGKISIEHIVQKHASHQLSSADKTFLALLKIVAAKPEDLRDEKNYERLKAELEAASNYISDEVFNYWSQNKELRVEFDISNANPQDLSPLNNGTILHVRVYNEKHRVSVSFDERSKGFVWFFSFLVYFSQIKDEHNGKELILLLDEPGLSLHAKAQGDFLNFIDEKLAPENQVIYTTHSPFMINPQNLEKVRTVQDHVDRGTIISSDILKNDKDTTFPLQAALGYELSQTLFIGPNCLIVEGPSDLLYLQILSEICTNNEKEYLDDKWIIVPAGGADKISTFVTLLGANDLNIAVLLDITSKDQERIQKLKNNLFLKNSSVLPVGAFIGKKNADIEDLFNDDFYFKLVNKAYNLSSTDRVTKEKLNNHNPRIVKRIEEYFRQNNIKSGHFNHFKPAMYFLRHQSSSVSSLDENCVDTFSTVFSRINELLP